jgi:hypothetical protein
MLGACLLPSQRPQRPAEAAPLAPSCGGGHSLPENRHAPGPGHSQHKRGPPQGHAWGTLTKRPIAPAVAAVGCYDGIEAKEGQVWQKVSGGLFPAPAVAAAAATVLGSREGGGGGGGAGREGTCEQLIEWIVQAGGRGSGAPRKRCTRQRTDGTGLLMRAALAGQSRRCSPLTRRERAADRRRCAAW